MGILDSVKNFFGGIVDEIEKIPEATHVVIAGTEHVISEGYGGVKSVVSDVYGGVKTVAQDAINLSTDAEHKALQPFTSTFQSFSYPVLFIAGGLGFYIIYEMSKTSREALPYMPQIMETGARVAPLLGRI